MSDNTKYMVFFCKCCTEVKAIPARRGRPPEFCTECVSTGKIRNYEEVRRNRRIEKAKERVDRLEIMLKSRGSHLSQQPEEQ